MVLLEEVRQLLMAAVAGGLMEAAEVDAAVDRFRESLVSDPTGETSNDPLIQRIKQQLRGVA